MSCKTGIDPGQFNQVATITTPSTPTDGETKPTWANLHTDVPVGVFFRGGNEQQRGSGVIDTAQFQIRLGFIGGITPKMRIRVPTTGTDDVYEILAVGDPTGRRQVLQAQCEKLSST